MYFHILIKCSGKAVILQVRIIVRKTSVSNDHTYLIQNHGLLVATKSVEATVYFFVSLEKCCYTQLLADAAAKGRDTETVKIGEEDAKETYKIVGSHGAGWFSGLPHFDTLERREGVSFQYEKKN